jgi:hypothetical protein
MFGDGCRMCTLQVYTHEVELSPNNKRQNRGANENILGNVGNTL